jgi:site-specific DNA-methyltransferase (adenine-specific)
MNLGKAFDKTAGAERKVVGINPNHRGESQMVNPYTKSLWQNGNITLPLTDLAKQWDGWGTALKPANEPIVLARKPLSEKTVALNVEKWGCGAINIDASRIGAEERQSKTMKSGTGKTFGEYAEWDGEYKTVQGRWPANLLLDETAAEMLGEPSRFFYVAKASKRERNAGHDVHRYGKGIGEGKDPDAPVNEKNHHPTVKPVKLMEYLCRLITPLNGIILDPFMGSGTTGVAAKNLNFNFIGIEMNEEYMEIASRRIK